MTINQTAIEREARRHTCSACGDVASMRYRKRWLCRECYDELANGKIVNQNINFFGGVAASREDDAGPWQQNAVRHLEDG